jgi:hypothetical protein
MLDSLLYPLSLIIGKSWAEGAQAVLRCAVVETAMKNGGYYMCGGEYGPDCPRLNCLSAYAMDLAMANEYMTWAVKRINPTATAAPNR